MINLKNNKGYLVIELILASIIAMTIAYFLIDITFTLKNKNDDLYLETKLLTNKTLMTKEVMKDVTNYGVIDVDTACSTADVPCADITYKINPITKRIRINKTNRTFEYGVYNTSTNAYTGTYYNKKIDPNLIIGDVEVTKEIVSGVSTGAKNDAFLIVKFPAKNEYLKNDYGLNMIIPYNSKDGI